MLSFLTGIGGKMLGVGALLVGAFVGISVLYLLMQNYKHEAQLAQQQLAGAQVQITTLNTDHTNIVAALQTQLKTALARAEQVEQIRSSINAAPVTHSCVSSPAIGAVLNGLRQQSRGKRGSAASGHSK